MGHSDQDGYCMYTARVTMLSAKGTAPGPCCAQGWGEDALSTALSLCLLLLRVP